MNRINKVLLTFIFIISLLIILNAENGKGSITIDADQDNVIKNSS